MAKREPGYASPGEYSCFFIARLVERADEAMQEYLNDKDNDFKNGRSLDYYEMLDILRTELDLSEQDLNEFGLDFDLEENIYDRKRLYSM